MTLTLTWSVIRLFLCVIHSTLSKSITSFYGVLSPPSSCTRLKLNIYFWQGKNINRIGNCSVSIAKIIQNKFRQFNFSLDIENLEFCYKICPTSTFQLDSSQHLRAECKTPYCEKTAPYADLVYKSAVT